ncbi:hypothetical protein FRC17_002008 [Serendipita sp. 399]|nr:hypothetical protein FRC17_002008 [Serendipita sp. 399]
MAEASNEAPIPNGDADFETIWIYIKEGMDNIMANPESGEATARFNGLYTCVYNFCSLASSRSNSESNFVTDKKDKAHCSDLYNKLVQYFVDYLARLYDASRPLEGEDLLHYYLREWDKYSMGVIYIDHAFKPLSRYWIPRKTNEDSMDIYPASSLAMVQWKCNMLLPIQDEHQRFTSAILGLIDSYRKGVSTDLNLAQKAINALTSIRIDEEDETSLELYKEHFENAFFTATEIFYQSESEALLAQNTIPGYLARVDAILQAEDNCIALCHDIDVRKSLKSKCEQFFIQNHTNKLWDVFSQALDDNKDEDLHQICSILARTSHGLDPLIPKFEDGVKRAGRAAISNLLGKDQPDPKDYVNTLFDVYQKYRSFVQNALRSNKGFVSALDSACRDFMKWNATTKLSATKSAELLATHVDRLLRKNVSPMEDLALEEALDQSIVILKYIGEPDSFLTFYTSNLSKRLIHDLSVSDEMEASMIQKLKDLHGFHYTQKLQRMFTDMFLSKGYSEEFNEQRRGSSNHVGAEISFTIRVGGQSYWPLQLSIQDYIVPRELLSIQEGFISYFKKKFNSRVLEWLWNYSKNELRTNYLDQRYILMTSSYQAAILLRYNHADTLSLDELSATTGITTEWLVMVLGTLIDAKILLADTQFHYSLNSNWTSKKIRVNISMPIKVAPVEIDRDRQYVVQGAIVRSFKRNRTMKYPDLVKDIILRLNGKITPTYSEIKKTFNYLA